jgi:hypothetical protein
MKKLFLTVKDIDQIIGITSGILHYCDKINLLKPSHKAKKGYRVCDKDILECIANTYKSDNRFKKYINQFSDKDLSDFLYESIMCHLQK